MDFLAQLSHAISGWNKDPIEDEWLFARFREQHVESMSAAEAFEVIGPVVDVLLRQSDESTATEVLETLIALARQSDTTEIPPGLLDWKPAIEAKFSNSDDYSKIKVRELFRHYRL